MPEYPSAGSVARSTEATEVPAPLFELAEALLKHRYVDPSSLNALLTENEEITV